MLVVGGSNSISSLAIVSSGLLTCPTSSAGLDGSLSGSARPGCSSSVDSLSVPSSDSKSEPTMVAGRGGGFSGSH